MGHFENWPKILQNFRKAVFREVTHGLFTFSFLSLLAVHELCGRREWLKSTCKLKMLCKNSLINWPRKFQLDCYMCSITILRKIILTIPNLLIIKKKSLAHAENTVPLNSGPSKSNIIFAQICTEPLRHMKSGFMIRLMSEQLKQIIEQFQTEYILADTPRLGRAHTLSYDDRTKITEHVKENPGMSERLLLKNSATRVKWQQRSLLASSSGLFSSSGT